MVIIEKPVITEKSLALAQNGVYTFYVAKSATAPEIAKAVAALYKVEVTKTRTVAGKGQTVRRRTGIGRQKDTKKALVTLKKGQTIKDFQLEEEKPEKTEKAKKDKE